MIRHVRRQNRQSILYLYVRCISAHCTRIPIRSHSRRTPQKRAFSNSLAEGSAVSSRGRLRIADNWHPFPVLQATIQRNSDVLKKKRGHVPSSRAPLLCYGPCSSQCVLGTWNIIRSCWKASFLRTRAIVCKLLLEPYGIEASFSSRKMKAKPHVVITRCTGEWMRVPSRGCNSCDRCATNGHSLSRMHDFKHFSPIDFVINKKYPQILLLQLFFPIKSVFSNKHQLTITSIL